jgi:hypothetical protein
MRRPAALMGPVALLCAAGLLLVGCAPSAPKGVDKERLDEAVSGAIGDPASCLMLAEQDSGKRVYRYNSYGACDRKLPACDRPGVRKLEELLRDTVKDGQARALSCNTQADASRGVGWASGVIAGKSGPLVYAAMMEGDRAFPGRMMAERLARAFEKAGLQSAN